MHDNHHSCVLIIEDDLILNDMIANIIRTSGQYDVIQCYDGQSALDLLVDTKIKPELVLCDINLPELSGINFVQQLMAKNLNVSVCFMSGDHSPDTMLKALQLGAVDFLCKPINIEEITEKIPNLIQYGSNRLKLNNEISNVPEIDKIKREQNLFRVINSISKDKV